MKTRLRQTLIIIVLSVVVSLAVNTLSNHGIPLVSEWPSISGSDSISIPPSATEGDPPFISLDEAVAKFQSPDVLFIDARDPEDYEYGHIAGSISLPYDYLEEYWDKVSPGIPRNQDIVIYCSGTECESSLFLGRELAFQGYKNVHIFYGGWREWERSDLPIEKSK